MKTKAQPKLLPDYRPETIDELMWSPYYCDDCNTWHENYTGLEIDNGEILDVNCDTDGNWDREGTGEKATEENYERLNRELMAQTDKAVKEYLQHCAESGDDPLHNFFVPRTVKRKERWNAKITPWLGLAKYGFAVTECWRGKQWFSPGEVPKHISEFLGLQKVGDRFCMEGITSFDQMVNADKVNPTAIRFTVENETPRPDKVVQREIKAIAKRNLERKS